MIQVTHLKGLPRTIDYWDYYILCRCVKHAGSVLQRMEYWDGTKAGGNIHAEQINDQLKEAGKQPTQDTSRFVYKSRDELAWEMLDVCGERVTYDLLDYLSNTLHLLNTRRNPYKAFDRTLQYEFQSLLVQDRLNQLNAIIKHFIALGRQMRPVLFAIEQLTLEGYYIHRVEKDGVLDGKGDLTIEEVTKKLRALHELVEKDNEGCKQPIIKGEKRYKPVLPYFIRADMGRDEQLGFSKESDIPLCKSAQSSVQENTMDCADVHDALCKSAQAIPVITNSNNNSNNDTVRESTDTAHVSDDNAPTPSLANSPSSLQESTEESTPAPSDEQSSKQGSGISDSQSKDMPPAQETGKTSSGKGKKDSKPGNTTAKKPTPGAEEKALRRQVQKWIDEKRGYKLYGSATEKQIFAEQNAVSMFALKLLNEQQGNHEDGCTWDELDHLWKETRKDTYWGKPENIGRIGGYALQQQFTTIILGKYRKTKLKQMRDQNAAQGATQTGTNMASAVQEHRQLSDLERRNAELRAKYGQKQIS